MTVARAAQKVSLSWPSPLPKPAVSGDSATYAEVLPGVDLLVRATVTGFTRTLVVKAAQAAADPALRRVVFALGGEGVSVRGNKQGGVSAVAGDGAELLRWDGAWTGKGGAGSEVAGQVESTVELVDGRVEVVPDAALLTGAETQFPVSISATPSLPECKSGRTNTPLL